MNSETAIAIEIRDSVESDSGAIRALLLQAFGADGEGPEIVELVDELFNDPSARPLLSLLACSADEAVGHILFSNARIVHSDRKTTVATILAPLAVQPEMQSRGIGARLIRAGLARLADTGIDVVFVLGYPDYYTRHGFEPALPQGLEAPFPIPTEHHDAWMVQTLSGPRMPSPRGRVVCADALDDQRYWVA